MTKHLLFAIALVGLIGGIAAASADAAEPEQDGGTHVLYVLGQPDGPKQIAMPDLGACERARSELLKSDMPTYGGRVVCGVHWSIRQSEFENAMQRMRPLTPDQILELRERFNGKSS